MKRMVPTLRRISNECPKIWQSATTANKTEIIREIKAEGQ
jgi:hypothetical protein